MEKVNIQGVPETMLQTLFARAAHSQKKEHNIMETMNPFIMRHMKEKSIEASKARFTWGLKIGKELESMVPELTWIKDVSLVEGMKELYSVYHVLGRIQPIRNISNKLVILRK